MLTSGFDFFSRHNYTWRDCFWVDEDECVENMGLPPDIKNRDRYKTPYQMGQKLCIMKISTIFWSWKLHQGCFIHGGKNWRRIMNTKSVFLILTFVVLLGASCA
jgi:hypothetical protein